MASIDAFVADSNDRHFESYRTHLGGEISGSSSIGATKRDTKSKTESRSLSLERASLFALARYANNIAASFLESNIYFDHDDPLHPTFSKVVTQWPTAVVCDFTKYLSPLALESFCRQLNTLHVNGGGEIAMAANEAWRAHFYCENLDFEQYRVDWKHSAEDFIPVNKARARNWIQYYFKRNIKFSSPGGTIVCTHRNMKEVCLNGSACKFHTKGQRSTSPVYQVENDSKNKLLVIFNCIRLSSPWLTELDISDFPQSLIGPLSQIEELQRNLKTFEATYSSENDKIPHLGEIVKAFPNVTGVVLYGKTSLTKVFKTLIEGVAKNGSQLCRLSLKDIGLTKKDAVYLAILLKAMRYVESFELEYRNISNEVFATVFEGLRQSTPSPNGVSLIFNKWNYDEESRRALQSLIDSFFGSHIQVLGLPSFSLWSHHSSSAGVEEHSGQSNISASQDSRAKRLKLCSEADVNLTSLQGRLQALQLSLPSKHPEGIGVWAPFLETSNLVTLKLKLRGRLSSRWGDNYLKALSYIPSLRHLSFGVQEMDLREQKKFCAGLGLLKKLQSLELDTFEVIELECLKLLAWQLKAAGQQWQLLSIKCRSIRIGGSYRYQRLPSILKKDKHHVLLLHILFRQVVNEVYVEFQNRDFESWKLAPFSLGMGIQHIWPCWTAR